MHLLRLPGFFGVGNASRGPWAAGCKEFGPCCNRNSNLKCTRFKLWCIMVCKGGKIFAEMDFDQNTLVLNNFLLGVDEC